MGKPDPSLVVVEATPGKFLVEKGAPAAPSGETDLVTPALGVALALLLGLPAAGLGAAMLAWAALAPGAPVWSTSYALMFLAAGVAVLVTLPFGLTPPGARSPGVRQRRWLLDALARLTFLMVPLNFAMGPYMVMLSSTTPATRDFTLGLILAANGLVAVGVAWHALRCFPAATPALPGRRLLELHASTLDRAVRCPYCATMLTAAEAVACLDCETLHHRECWAENEGCTTYACHARRAVTLTGGEVAEGGELPA